MFTDIYLCYKHRSTNNGHECIRFTNYFDADEYFRKHIGFSNVHYSTMIPQCRFKPLFIIKSSLLSEIRKQHKNFRINLLPEELSISFKA
jgi:hypothetical protein